MLSSLYYHSTSGRQKLRIGVLVDGTSLIRVFADVLRDIRASDFASLEYVIYNAATVPEPTAAAPSSRRTLPPWMTAAMRSREYREALAWTLYQKLDQRLSPITADPLAMEDATPLLEGVDSLAVEPITSRFVHRFPEEALEAIKAKDLDVILRFGFNILKGGILQAARYGVWSFHHGDNDSYRGGPAHFWELVEGNPLSGVILQVLTEKLDDGKILAKGLFATDPGLSLNRNRLQPYWGSQHFVIQKLWELHQFGPEHLTSNIITGAPYTGKKKIYRRPSNTEVARWLGPKLASKAGLRIGRKLSGGDRIHHWRMAVRASGRHVLDSGEKAAMEGFHWIESPKGHFYADPFGLEVNGAYWLFFEDYSYATRRGVLACGSISPEGVLGEVRTILDTGSHASYPYVFADGDSIYMIPETRAAGAVRLYKAKRFPWEWEQVAELFQGEAADTSVWKQDSLWWFFTTLMDPRGRGAFLYLYSAETLTGKWTYHPANPICYDVRRARSAGRIHLHQGRLIRPSQDCSLRYGYSFTLNEITHLSVDRYEERPLLTIDPTWERGLTSTHTYNQSGALEFTDGTIPRPANLIL